MKKMARILCVVIAGSILSVYAINYLEGLKGSPLTLGAFPAAIVPLLIGLLCLASLVITMLVALIKRRDRSGVLLFGALGFLLFLLPFVVTQATVFQAGFRARIKSKVTPEEIYQIADAVQKILPEGDKLPGPGKSSLWSEEYRARWDFLVRKTKIDKLDPWMVISKHSRSVVISWGGALAGHWGIIIDSGPDRKPGDIALGIKTFVSSH
jgi:hypothetical protein